MDVQKIVLQTFLRRNRLSEKFVICIPRVNDVGVFNSKCWSLALPHYRLTRLSCQTEYANNVTDKRATFQTWSLAE